MTCVVVLGPHRSGTSLVARILQHAGVNMGTRFRAPDEFNPEGYCEDLDFKELNQAILKLAGGTWWNPPSVINGEDMRTEFGTIMEKMLERKMAHNGVWGFKDPRMALLLDLYKPYLPSDTKYVVVSRNVMDIARSVYHREQVRDRRTQARGFHLDHWKKLTQSYYSNIMEYVAGRDAVIVQYEKLVHVPTAYSTVYNLWAHLMEMSGWALGLGNNVMSKSLGMIKYENRL